MVNGNASASEGPSRSSWGRSAVDVLRLREASSNSYGYAISHCPRISIT